MAIVMENSAFNQEMFYSKFQKQHEWVATKNPLRGLQGVYTATMNMFIQKLQFKNYCSCQLSYETCVRRSRLFHVCNILKNPMSKGRNETGGAYQCFLE